MLILASGSPRRRELFAQYGRPFEVVVSDAAELSDGLPPSVLSLRNAVCKADAVATTHPDDIVIGADTIVALDGRCYGKPASRAEALAMLLTFSGRTHEVITSVALRGPGKREEFSVATHVTFKPFSRETAEHYLEMVPVLDKAGAYAIQEHGELLVASIDGDFDNVVGLPCRELFVRLRAFERS